MSHMGEDLDEEMNVPVVEALGQPHPGPGIYDLQGVITHLGASIHAGHYVAHLKVDNEWVLFNDNKVA